MNVDEAVSSFANFVETICTCVQSKNGELLAELFDPMAYSLEEGVVGELVNRISETSILAQISSNFGSSNRGREAAWVADIIIQLKAIFSLSVSSSSSSSAPSPHDKIAFWTHLSDMKIETSLSLPWQFPIIQMWVRTAMVASAEADNALKQTGQINYDDPNDDTTRFQGQMIQKLMQFMNRFISEDTLVCRMFLFNSFMKIQLMLKRLSQVPDTHITGMLTLVDRAVKSPPPMAFSVTYHYYIGRYFITQQQFRHADEHLTFAFDNCPDSYQENKRQILFPLIVARLIRGLPPTPTLLHKYAHFQYTIHIFLPIISAYKSGDIKTYHAIVDAYAETFYLHGVWTAMKWRMEQTLCRNLILNIYQTIQEITPVGRVIIPFKAIYEALRLAGVAGVGGSGGNNSNNNAVMFETLDDVECLLVGLIDEKLINGKIQRSSKVIAMDSKNQIPCLYQFYSERNGKREYKW